MAAITAEERSLAKSSVMTRLNARHSAPVNASYIAYKRIMSRKRTGDVGLEGPPTDGLGTVDREVVVTIHGLAAEHPRVVACTSLEQLKVEIAAWKPHAKHWINIKPFAGGIGLAQAMVILQETLSLPPFSVLDALKGGCLVRLDRSAGCVYTTILTWFQPKNHHQHHVDGESKPGKVLLAGKALGTSARALLGGNDRHMSQVSLLRQPSSISGESATCKGTGTVMQLFDMMMSSDDETYTETFCATSRTAQRHCPSFDRACFFLTRHALVSIWNSDQHNLCDVARSWFEPFTLHDYYLDRQQGPDYVFYKLVGMTGKGITATTSMSN